MSSPHGSTVSPESWDRCNALALFRDTDTAERAISTLKKQIADANFRIHISSEDKGREMTAEYLAEMQDEINGALTPRGFWRRGALRVSLWGALGLALGALVGLIAGAFWFGGDGPLRFAAPVSAFGLAGFLSGFVASASHQRQGESDDADDMPVEEFVLVAAHAGSSEVIERAGRLLIRAGAQRVHFVNREGVPLPPQHDHPRPADTPDQWWRAEAE